MVATPRSPIAPALESGAMVRKGTVVWIAFKLPSNLFVTLPEPCVKAGRINPVKQAKARVNLLKIIILKFYGTKL
jgi:hypothetical protein